MIKTIKLIGGLCLLWVAIIGGWFTVEILVPSLTAFRATTPYLTFHLKPWNNFQAIAFTPDGKQFVFLYKPDRTKEIKRWYIDTGRELPTIHNQSKNQCIFMLSEDGRYYVAYDTVNNKYNNQLFRLSDQSAVGTLPPFHEHQDLYKIIGGKHPIAVYIYEKQIREYYLGPTDETYIHKRRFYLWDVLAKHYISSNPPTRTLYNYMYDTPNEVTVADDGTKVLSLWPTYTTKKKGKTTTVTKNFVHWIQNPPNRPVMNIFPKEVSLLNELNRKIITLPFPKEYTDLPSFKPGQYLTPSDEKYFLWFDFGWTHPASSPNQNLYAAVAANKWYENGEIWCYDLPHRCLKWRYYRENFCPDILHFSPNSKMLAAGGDATGYDFEGNPRLDQLNGAGILSVLDAKNGNVLRAFTEQTLWQQIRDRTRIAIIQLQSRQKSDEGSSYNNKGSYNYNSAPLADKSEHVEQIAWSPDNKFLAASYEDGTVKLWRVTE